MDNTENAAISLARGKLYDATIDNETLAIYDRHTGEKLNAVAVIPDYPVDLVALANMVPPQMAGELARIAAWRALGKKAPPPPHFDA